MLQNHYDCVASEAAQHTEYSDDSFESKPKFLKFDKVSKTVSGQSYVNQIQAAVDLSIQRKQERKRRRKPRDQGIFEQQIAAVASELACHILQRDERGLKFNRAKGVLCRRDGSTPSFVTKKFVDVVDGLIDAGLVTQVKGLKAKSAKRGEATAIYPTEALEVIVYYHGLALADFKRHSQSKQSVVIKAPKGFKGNRYRCLPNSPEAISYVQDMKDINSWIGEARIEFDMSFAGDKPIDTSDTFLQRQFGEGFKTHGRLYGGFWQGLEKKQRRQGLTINGEPIVCLDYGQMILRTAYSHAQAPMPSGDLYAVPGFDRPTHREGIKRVISSLFFRLTPMKRLSKDMQSKLRGVSAVSMKFAIKRYHQGISHLMDTNIGHELCLLESNLLVKVLERLRAKGIVALPVHDSIIVPKSSETVARQLMETTGLELLGVPCPVRRDDGDEGSE